MSQEAVDDDLVNNIDLISTNHPNKSGGPLLRTFAIASVGGALEFYDFIIFVFLTKTISIVFFPEQMPSWLRETETYGLFAAGYLARPIGGLLMAHVGDTKGRRPMFILGVLLMACPTLLIGLLPTYAQIGYGAPLLLLGCRVLQGAAVGGEVPGSWVFVAEHAPRGRIGCACGLVTAGLTAGIFVGSVVNLALHLAMTQSEITAYGWRLPFLLGGVTGLLGAVVRHKLAETPVFEMMRRTAQVSKSAPLNFILRSEKKSLLISIAASWFLTAEIIVVVLMSPPLLQHRLGLTDTQVALSGISCSFFLSIGCVFCGRMIDRIGLSMFLAFTVPVAIMTPYMLYYGTAESKIPYLLIFMLSGFVAGSISLVPFVMVRSFPPAAAYSGVSLAYNVAYAAAGGLTPPLVSASYGVDLLAPAHYVAVVCAIGMSAVFAGTALRSRALS